MIVAVGEEFFTRASRTSPSISRFTSSKCLICARRNIGFSANNQRRFDEGTLDSLLTISDDLTKAKGLKIPPFAVI
ncbi:hypothetical protein CY35_14G021500 [Sphagnum magellanicum]|nr:hypothetical protein CY35_14G021500 [Sphagnum magellanicum]